MSMRTLLAAALTLCFSTLAFGKIVTEDITYTDGDIQMKGYIAYDDSIEGKRPGILVVHEWWGHNEHARKKTRELAELGYTALAVDMYGDGKTAEHPSKANEFSKAVFTNLEAGKARFLAAHKTLTEHATVDAEKTGAVGYCFGGGVVLHMARMGVDIDGVVSFHGSLQSAHTAEAGGIKARILVCHGGDDKLIPIDQIKGFHEEMLTAKANYTFESYPDAPHSFTNPDATKKGETFGLPIGYQEAADKQSWQSMKDFFESIF